MSVIDLSNLIDKDLLLFFKNKIDVLLSAKANSTDLSTVATSGSYDDLSNKPDIAAAYTLPTASSTTKGGVKVGSNLTMDGDTMSATNTTYANATTSTAGLMSTTDKSKLDGIAAGAEVNVNADWNATSGDAQILNKPTSVSDFSNDSGFQTASQVNSLIESATDSLATSTWVTTQLESKVDTVTGKELSSNDFTDALLTKLNGIATGAEANVNANWTATSGDEQILNKPTALSDFTNDSGFQTSSQVASAISTATSSLATTSALNTAVSGLASEAYVDNKISAVYKPSGSVAFASLPTLTTSVLGNVYNVTNSFTTTSDFVEGEGKSYGAGTNVAIVDVDGTLKYDALAFAIDLTNYVSFDDISLASNTDIAAMFE